ncbi:MAG: SDR family NAD(P)-dependent oxidoreductase [Burkholderiaceae bacterium]
MDLQLDGRIAWVTGGGSGIGAEIVSTLVEHGCVVYVADNNADAAADIAIKCGARGVALKLDVGNADQAAAAAERIVSERGRIDIVVNNAGILKTGSVVDASIADWDEVCRVNLSGVYYCCKAAIAPMVAQRYGKIVNIASVSAMKGGGTFGNVLYGTTKAGVVAMTKGLARDLAPYGINVNAIAPGVVETDMTNSLLTEERRKSVLAAIPLGRMASTSDIARVVVLLASDACSYITGETIAVDGGYLTR